ncbi:HpcH/HpaI aldolase/citrate lyase family protein [Sphingoaurantiacus capsulatus]|uniref:HpcH/HpaI aldolase/citrate lyase family protein n=1 Tax=Sphingoaurantiacus capsulatus TaxID=1771310 RepID=A0ABV7XA52_9SPHN
MTLPDRPRRSVLYMPASNPRALEKARSLGCDAVILDLEDAVAPDAKEAARAAAVAAVREGGFGRRELAIRVNGFGTPWMADDFAAAVAARPNAIVVPKVDSEAQAVEAVRLAYGIPVWAMIESPKSLIAVERIAAVEGVTALIAGMADFAKDLRAKPGRDRLELMYALQRMLVAARAAGIVALDGIHADIPDLDALDIACKQGAAMGFDGKTLVHPNQIEAANRAYSPDPAAIAEAEGLIAAFEAGQAEGKGVTTYNGRMVEVLHVAEARRLLAFAEATRG